MTDPYDGVDLPNIDLLEYAKRHLIAHMLESGIKSEIIETYIGKISFSNPLRTHFATQLIACLPEDEREDCRGRLLGLKVGPTVRVTIHSDRHNYIFPISSYLNQKSIDALVKRVFQSDEVSGETPQKDN